MGPRPTGEQEVVGAPLIHGAPTRLTGAPSPESPACRCMGPTQLEQIWTLKSVDSFSDYCFRALGVGGLLYTADRQFFLNCGLFSQMWWKNITNQLWTFISFIQPCGLNFLITGGLLFSVAVELFLLWIFIIYRRLFFDLLVSQNR